MTPTLIITVLVAYFAVLILISILTSINANSDTFFTGDKQSPWYLVAFGMIGASLSGVTFISVPGKVLIESMAYFQIVLGYVLGYMVIAKVLMPLYYKMNLVSIYEYLLDRFGIISYKTGAAFFILSRTLGATARLYLVVNILHNVILKEMGVPFWVTTFVILAMILVYTFEGGVKTIVWTDTLQTFCMLAGLVICVVFILNNLHLGIGDAVTQMSEKGYNKIFYTDPYSKLFFVKQILAGAFITITMTGME